MSLECAVSPQLYNQYFLDFREVFLVNDLASMVVWETLGHFLSVLRQPISLGVDPFQIEVLLDHSERFFLLRVLEFSYQVLVVL